MEVENRPKYRKVINGLVYKTVDTDLEVEECFKLYQTSFMKDEPITKNFRDESLQSTEEKTFFDNAYFYDLIKQGVSLIVTDPDVNNKVIGMRISGCFERSDVMGEANFNERFLDPVTRWKLLLSQIELSKNKKSPRMKWKIGATKSRFLNANNEGEPDLSSFSFYINFLNAALDSAGTAQELFETENDLQKIYYMMMMTVDSSYRGRGIASQMITSCFEVGKLNDCDSAFVVATNPYTARIFRKHQMINLKSIPWASIEFRGEYPCRGKNLGSECIESFYIRF